LLPILSRIDLKASLFPFPQMLFTKSASVWQIFAKRTILYEKDWFFSKSKIEPTYSFIEALLGEKQIFTNCHSRKIN
jgi:hypothetical protein